MGDILGSGDPDEKPVHEVFVDDFWIGMYPVTQGQWQKVMKNNPSRFKSGDDYPVDSVSWEEVQEFVRRLNRDTGRKYRLPTEAEWEYAARSGGKEENWAGTNDVSKLGEYAWYGENSGGRTHPVGRKKPNGLGLYDMSGNVLEWCADWYEEKYCENSPIENPKAPATGKYRVLRGGSWEYAPEHLRISRRDRGAPSVRKDYIGFRLALPVE